MGLIRRRADRMFAPWPAHVITDLVIVGIILSIARPNLALHPTAVWFLSAAGERQR
jgi:hypothetical protein